MFLELAGGLELLRCDRPVGHGGHCREAPHLLQLTFQQLHGLPVAGGELCLESCEAFQKPGGLLHRRGLLGRAPALQAGVS